VARDENGNICSDYDEYERKGIRPVVYTFSAFKKELNNGPTTNIFVDGTHLTEGGESIIANEIYKFFINEKLIESF
jgi:hypothetical protein